MNRCCDSGEIERRSSRRLRDCSLGHPPLPKLYPLSRTGSIRLAQGNHWALKPPCGTTNAFAPALGYLPPMPPWAWILAGYAAMSLVTFGAFAWDKRSARLGRWRTSERTLHTLELLGGWPGAILAMRLVRHKNRKGRYIAVLALIVAVHLAAWALYGYYR